MHPKSFLSLARVILLALLLAWPAAARAGTLVRFDFNVNGTNNEHSVFVDLFDALTPQTVANFLNYVNNDRYTSTVVHRSVPGFIVQGGGFDLPDDFNLNDASPFPHIATFPSPVNEFHRTNTRGTISMAKLPGNPNSATSEWFFNLGNNAANLDNQNGGFTAFGWVVGSGLTTVIDKIATFDRYYYKQFNDTTQPEAFPVQNFDPESDDPVVEANLVMLQSVTVISEHASFQNPIKNLDVNNDNLVTNNDALNLINDLFARNSHNVDAAFSGTFYLDVNGDGRVNPSDLIKVINFLKAQQQIAQPSGALPMALPMASTLALVPEPSSVALATTGAIALLGYAVRRRSLAKRPR